MVLNTRTREESGFLCKGGERNVSRSIVGIITLAAKEIPALLSCVNKKHDQHGNDYYDQKDFHTPRIA
jgi:hypothetical protein